MEKPGTLTLKFGLYAALALALLTIITFGFAIIAVPPTEPFCQGNCMEYPYSDLLLYYPRDYNWMYLAIFQIFTFILLFITFHNLVPAEKKIFSSTGVALTLISSTVLLIDYFIQFAVIPISMMKGETEGIALLTQYNGHGVFIALEELGYITMSIAMFFMVPVFPASNKLNKTIRWVLFLPLLLNIISFIILSIKFGIDRNYRFEVITISIDWLFLIATGILTAIYFRRLLIEKN